MINTIYVENDVASHPRVIELLKRFSGQEIIPCQHYAELFNRKAQNFRLQKQNPSLILSAKQKHFVLPAPAAYSIGGNRNYYFSHMMNCVYDCRYCFLQGMYQSANYVLFVNYEDFSDEIQRIVAEHKDETCYFFSGYDCDSLALEPVTQFVESILPVFEATPQAVLELRTKSTQIRNLLAREPLSNCVVAFSMSPDNIVQALEVKTPGLEKRLQAMQKLQDRGWSIGLRFDPIIYHRQFEENYRQLFSNVFSALNTEAIHSVSLGGFRMPVAFYQKMLSLYPDEKLFASPLEERDGMMEYKKNMEMEMLGFCEAEILKYIDQSQFFPCYE